jgi:hypothetical protein
MRFSAPAGQHRRVRHLRLRRQRCPHQPNRQRRRLHPHLGHPTAPRIAHQQRADLKVRLRRRRQPPDPPRPGLHHRLPGRHGTQSHRVKRDRHPLLHGRHQRRGAAKDRGQCADLARSRHPELHTNRHRRINRNSSPVTLPPLRRPPRRRCDHRHRPRIPRKNRRRHHRPGPTRRTLLRPHHRQIHLRRPHPKPRRPPTTQPLRLLRRQPHHPQRPQWATTVVRQRTRRLRSSRHPPGNPTHHQQRRWQSRRFNLP